MTIPSAALAQHVAIVGKTGAGKTSTAKLAIEQVVAEGARVCVLDPVKSDWWGVISSRDGKRPGLPFHVLGGPHAHVPLHSGAGAAIAELVARGDLTHSVLDMADFEPGGQQRFFVQFAETLLKRMRGVLYLVLEEAHEFAPKERAGFEKENLSIHYAKKLATAGRSKGIRLIVATQRIQSLHNALLGSCDTLIAHRLTAPADQEPITKWLKGNVEKSLAARVSAELASLKTGTGWLCSGEAKVFERIAFPRISTFDNSATPTDDDRVQDVKGGDVDLGALRALIGEAVVEAEANDPRKLKARIKELEKEIATTHPGPTFEQIKAIKAEAHDEGWRDAEGHVRAELEGLAEQRAAAAVADLRTAVRPHVEALHHALANGDAPGGEDRKAPSVAGGGRTILSAPERLVNARRYPPPRAWTPAAPKVKRTESATIGRTCQRMIDALAMMEELGVEMPVTRELVAGWLGISAGTGSFTNRLSDIRKAGYVVDGPGLTVALTDDGRAAAAPAERPPSLDALHDTWRRRVGGTAARIMDVLIRAYPDHVSREKIAAEIGVSHETGSFTNRLSDLRRPGLIRDIERGGAVAATELLFPEGLT